MNAANFRRHWLYSGAAAFAFTSLPPVAQAQQEAEEEELMQDVVTITARKKEETLIDAPIAVSAFSEEQLDQLNLESIDDVARFTPGLSFSKAFGRSTERPVIRGQSNVLAGVQFGVESGTAYFIDGIYYNGSIQNIDPNNLARVEVVKGPQSALYGRNTYAGAINFITKGASDTFEGSLQARAGSNDTYEVSGGITGPITDTLGFRLSGRYYEYGGEFTNAVTNETVGFEETASVSGTLEWTPSSNFTSTLTVTYNEDDDGPLPLFLQPATENNCAPGYRALGSFRIVPGFGGVPFPREFSDNDNQYYCGVIEPGQVALNTGRDADGIPNTIDGIPSGGLNFFANSNYYALDDGTAFDGIEREQVLVFSNNSLNFGDGYELRGLVGYRDEDERQGFDSDHSSVNWFLAPAFTGAEAFFANTNRDDIQDYSLEIKLLSPQERRFRWAAGLYHYDFEVDEFDLTFAAPRNGVFDKVRGITSSAIFGLMEYDVTDRLSVTLEGRYSEEEKTDTDSPIAEVSYDSFTPRLTLDYEWPGGGTVYGVYAEGVKPGGLNGAEGAEIGFPTYEQEESDNFELGLKLPLLDNRFTLTGAGFFTDATNVQLTTAIGTPTGGLISIATNQGAAEIYGIELDINGSFNDFFSGGATYAWTDATFTEGCDPDEWTFTSGGGLLTDPDNQTGADFTADFTGAGPATCDISGNRLPLTSEHQASGFLRFDMPSVADTNFFATANVTYESSKFVQVHNRAETGAATILGARFGWESEDWTFAIYGTNLTDEDSIVVATRWLQTPLIFGGLNVGPEGSSGSAPRAFFGTLRQGPQYGAELKVRF
jgi:outer membrane receptor protein involved in Fe transport